MKCNGIKTIQLAPVTTSLLTRITANVPTMPALSIHLIYYVVFGISILTHSLAPLQLEHQLGGDWLISFTDESSTWDYPSFTGDI